VLQTGCTIITAYVPPCTRDQATHNSSKWAYESSTINWNQIFNNEPNGL